MLSLKSGRASATNLDLGLMPGPTRRYAVRVVIVAGASMLPTLRPGDCLLVRPGGRPRAGDLVVARFAARPELLVVKRAVRPDSDRWWVEGDNAAATDDSRTYGA
ncbi:MAG: S26 family signal peptidase, partial [Frankiales bacterium]|nr:S26 family signal peptidase [Frankiales bacterium]